MMNGLDENTPSQTQLLIQEVMRWKKVWELKEGKKIFKTIQDKIVSNDEGSQFTSLAETMLRMVSACTVLGKITFELDEKNDSNTAGYTISQKSI